MAVLNDVIYVLKATPRSKSVISHIDKLRAAYGTIPTCWNVTCTANDQTEDTGQAVGNITTETDHKLEEIVSSVNDRAPKS